MPYIVCNQKKSRPKVGVDVCKKCRRRRTCADYADYLQPSLFPNLEKGPLRKRIRPLRAESEFSPTPSTQEQLKLITWGGS